MIDKKFRTPLIISLALTVTASLVLIFINPLSAAVCAVLGVTSTAVFTFQEKKRNINIIKLNDHLQSVLSGDYSLNLAQNTEGELSILQNNLVKVITMLKTSNETVLKDKYALADALADISHQLKTPLTSMMVIADILPNETSEEKRKELSNILETQCEKMSWLVSTLLKISKLDAGTITLTPKKEKIGDIVTAAISPFLITMDLKGIELVKKISDIEVNADKNWTVEAIGNIIKNCIEHTPEGGRLEITASDTTLFTEVKISDNGCGISKEDLPHIFERFYQGKNASKESVGIGLALSKAILNNENAVVSADSEETKGTAFIIKFYKSVI